MIETEHNTGQETTRGRYHGGRRPSSDDSLHSPTVIPPLALDKPSIMKRYHRWRTTRWGVTARLPMMVTLHDTQFVKCRWWNDGWTVKSVVTWRSSASMIPAPDQCWCPFKSNLGGTSERWGGVCTNLWALCSHLEWKLETSSSVFTARSLGLTILGEIFAYDHF